MKRRGAENLKFIDSNASSANIVDLNYKFHGLKVAIIGVGGTGSYLLDLVSKLPVDEIHLFDGDILLVKNYFRAPGAPLKGQVKKYQYKVDYFKFIYSRMHRNINAHKYDINPNNFNELLKFDIVFICTGDSNIKKELFSFLIENKINFIDVGIGIQKNNSKLTGTIYVTNFKSNEIGTSKLYKNVITNHDPENNYNSNIQIAELNSLNAAMAVIRWKKSIGVYSDLKNEANSYYLINNSEIINE